MEIQHPRHEHPLVLRENPGNVQLTCNKCRSHRETAFYYYCVQCGGRNYFSLHYSCAVSLPQQINHPLHPHHPLALLTGRDYTCPICKVNHRSGSDLYRFEPQHPNYSAYTCIECNFDIHLDCAMFPSIIYYEGHEHIQQPLCHLQPMALVLEKDGECFVCRLPCHDQSGPAFACIICKCLIHKSCAELPSEIAHPFHPKCHLFLRANHRRHTCRCCEKRSYTFVFACDSCNFNICVACSSLRPTIEYEGHDHLLCFVELERNPGHCNAHDSDCRQSVVVELLSCKQPCNILRCVQCDFNVHILCGPLPRTIKHKCHVHPLSLFDLVIEDDSGEYYCDACEIRRNPQLRVYYCAECKFVADVYCVLSEVTSILKGDQLKDVKLMSVAERKLIVTEMEEQSPLMLDNDKHKIVNASVEEEVGDHHDEGKFASMRLKDLVDKLKGKEREIVDTTYDYWSTRKAIKEHPKQVEDFIWRFHRYGKTDENSIKDLNRFLYERPTTTPLILSTRKQKPTPQQLVNSIKEFSHFTDRDFTKLMHSLHHSNSSGKITLLPSDLRLKVVKVGDYMVTWNLAHVLKELLAKHGDISGGTESKLSMEMKSIIFYLLCRVINSMCRTTFIEVTEDVLKNWFACLQIAKSNGFKIDFVYARLEGVMRAFFGLQTTRVENDVVAQMDQMLGSLKQEILERQAEMDRLLANFKSCMEYREKYRNSEKSNFIKECLSEASMFTWKIVGKDLL